MFVSQGRERYDSPMLPARHSRLSKKGRDEINKLPYFARRRSRTTKGVFILEQRLSQLRDPRTQDKAYEVKTCYLKGEPRSKVLLVEINASKGRETQPKATKTNS